jgi:hypothetical protein
MPKFAEDCKLLHFDIDFLQKWYTENYMKINIFKTNINYFTCKTNGIDFNYFVSDALIVRTDYVKDLGIMLDTKLHFHRHVDYLHSQALKLLISFIVYNFSSLKCLKVVYITLILLKLEHASATWSNLTLA